MPTESQRIAADLHSAYFGEAWHGPSLREVLAGITAARAAERPIPTGHSIFELVAHLHAWIVEVDATVRGKTYESLQGDRDWPPVSDTSSLAWERLLTQLEMAEVSLEGAVRDLRDDKLEGGDRPLYTVLHGIAQHFAYHAGQIVLLKKLAG